MASTSIFGQEKNPRGIPKAPFIANVEEYIGRPDGDVEGPLKTFQDAIAKYRYMDANLTQRRRSLEDKIPDIKKTLHMVEFLQEIREGKQKADDGTDGLDDEDDDVEEEVAKKPLTTTFELNDTLYAEAQLEDTDTVYLWLGANVMLSYKIPTAISLLRSKLGAAEASLKATIEDLEFLLLASNIGLLVGAIIWSLGCDIWGRRWSFNLTLLIAGVFGLAAGGSPDFVTLASLIAAVGVGAGGNMPVDSAVFLDFVPGSHQYLLTILSIWWSLGQLLCSLIAWPLIANFSCATSEGCKKSDNMGWRYLLFALGGLTLFLWGLRFFVFTLFESPRFLSGIGKDAEAADIIHKLAKYNGKTTTLTVEELAAPGRNKDASPSSRTRRDIMSKDSRYSVGHIRALFATPKMAWSTSLLIALWGIIGLASTLYNSFLPYFRAAVFGDGSLYVAYRNVRILCPSVCLPLTTTRQQQVILSMIGVPAAFLAGWAVEVAYLGRRGSLAISSGESLSHSARVFIAQRSPMMYGVLYAITPEIFPAKDRGTGNGLTAIANRVFGVMAPVIALYANIGTAVPVYIAAGMIIFAGFLALLLPYEPREKDEVDLVSMLA
ncbi:major facilitator superfamily domain-containing protein [Lanmaoa asiatica]|nr:major facilitator superfamily domain-containing protein [Lanmaoa asiatica]